MDSVLDRLDTNPYPLLRELRETEPVCWLPELNAWLVTRYDLAVAVLRDSRSFTVDDPRFTTARVVGPSMLSLDGPEHARHRKAFDRGLRPQALDLAAVENEITGLITAIRPRNRAEFRREFAGPLAAAVMADTLGLDQPADVILAWYDDIVRAVASLAGSAGTGAYQSRSFGLLAQSIKQAVSGGRSVLLTAAAGSLDGDELTSNAAVLLFGGIETTEGMIANAIVHMLGHRTHGERAPGQEAGAGAIEESLRLEPAAAMVDRYATRDVRLGGAVIRKSDQVTVSITGANRDPAVFDDPDRYDPRRPNAARHLAFAHGPHFCVGAYLATLEAERAVAAVAALPGLRLSEPAIPRGLVFRKPPALHAIWDPQDEDHQHG